MCVELKTLPPRIILWCRHSRPELFGKGAQEIEGNIFVWPIDIFDLVLLCFERMPYGCASLIRAICTFAFANVPCSAARFQFPRNFQKFPIAQNPKTRDNLCFCPESEDAGQFGIGMKIPKHYEYPLVCYCTFCSFRVKTTIMSFAFIDTPSRVRSYLKKRFYHVLKQNILVVPPSYGGNL